MALNLLRVYTPAEAEALMQRSFGQFQKRLAADQTKERLANVREQLADIRRMWDDPEVSHRRRGAVLQARGPAARDPDRAASACGGTRAPSGEVARGREAHAGDGRRRSGSCSGSRSRRRDCSTASAS